MTTHPRAGVIPVELAPTGVDAAHLAPGVDLLERHLVGDRALVLEVAAVGVAHAMVRAVALSDGGHDHPCLRRRCLRTVRWNTGSASRFRASMSSAGWATGFMW